MNSTQHGVDASKAEFSSAAQLALRIQQQPLARSVRMALLSLCLPVVLAWSQPAQAADAVVIPVAATTSTARTASPTADAVQEAFVRVADRIKPSVVTIYSERLPKTGVKPVVPGKPPEGKAPDGKAKPGDKSKPEVKPAPPRGDEEDEEEDDSMPFPFGNQDPRERRTSLGTGVVIRADGYVLTNYHVVKGAQVLRVIFNPDSDRPDRPTARIVGFDEDSDLAVLKVDRTDLPAVELADSDKVRIGEWAIAIGAPFDQARTVTVGVISAKSRHLDRAGGASLQDYIQTDASINPGNSGGPLVNLEGQLIGINTAILSPSRFNVGIGFAVPSNTVKQFLPTLMEGKRIQRGFIGIQYVGIDREVAKEFGVDGGMQISALYKDRDSGKYVGPAKDAGLQESDIIVAVNDQPIESSDDFRRIVSYSPPGTKINLSVVRPIDDRTEKRTLTLTLGKRPSEGKEIVEALTAPPTSMGTKLGIEVENADKLTSSDRTRFEIAPLAKGAVIVDVLPGSPADDIQLGPGLRITRMRVSGGAWINIANKAAFQQAEKALTPGARVLLQLRSSTDDSVYKVVIVPGKATVVPVSGTPAT